MEQKPKVIIRLSDYEYVMCDKYYDYIQENYPNDQEFDAIELINKISDCKTADVLCLINFCRLARNHEVIRYYKYLVSKKAGYSLRHFMLNILIVLFIILIASILICNLINF